MAGSSSDGDGELLRYTVVGARKRKAGAEAGVEVVDLLSPSPAKARADRDGERTDAQDGKAKQREQAKAEREAKKEQEKRRRRVELEMDKVARGTHKYDECTCVVDCAWITKDPTTANRVTEAMRTYTCSERRLKNGIKFVVEANAKLRFPTLRWCFHAPANTAGALLSQSQSQSQANGPGGLLPPPPTDVGAMELPPENEREYANLVCVPLTPEELAAAILRDELSSILRAVSDAHFGERGAPSHATTSALCCVVVTHGWRRYLDRLGHQAFAEIRRLEGFAARLSAKAALIHGALACRLLDFPDADGLANMLAIIARFVCEAPYREEKAYGEGFTEKAAAPTEAAKRAALDGNKALITCLRQLRCLPNMTQDGATAVAIKYPSLGHLYRRLASSSDGGLAFESELAGLSGPSPASAAGPSRAPRRFGPASARRVRVALTATDAGAHV